MIFAAGMALFALVLVARLFEMLRHVDQRFDTMQGRLQRIEDALRERDAGAVRSASPAPGHPAAAPPAQAPVPAPAAVSAPAAPEATPAARRADPVPPRAAATAATPAPAHRAASDIESEIGSRWVLMIGVLVLVLGVAFFIKYAFDRHWISETLRVATGTVVGAALAVAGLRLAGRGYPLYGRMVAGGGLAILYVSAYAASALYALVPAAVALGWMALVSALTVVAADRQRSAGLATMAIVLAGIAPFLVSTGADHHVVLFIYDAALVAATWLLVKRREWLFLALASFWLTWTTFALWWAFAYRSSYFASTELYLTAIAVMFALIARELSRSRQSLAPLIRAVLWGGVLLYHFASVAVLYDQSLWLLLYFIVVTAIGVALLKEWAWPRLVLWVVTVVPLLTWTRAHANAAWYAATLAMAAGIYGLHLVGQLRGLDTEQEPALAEMILFHLNGAGLYALTYPAVQNYGPSTAALTMGLSLWNGLLALACHRRRAVGALPHALALAFTFAAVAAAIRLDGPWITVAWAAEGAAVVWVAFLVRREPLRDGGIGLLALGICRLVFLQFGETTVSFRLLLNPRTITGAFIVALLYLTAWLHVRYGDRLRGPAVRIASVFIAAANVLTVAVLTADIYSFWELRGEQFTASLKREMSTSLTWAIYGMGLVGLGFNRESALLRYLGLALLGATVAKVFTVDLLELDGVYRIVGFVALGLVLLAASFLYHRSRRRVAPAGSM
jgi:uncharacterized membrane protein